MIKGIGTDIIEIARIRDGLQRHGQLFLDRLFTPDEQKYCERFSDPAHSYAGRFAAKEAVAKALGTGFGTELSWLDIEITNNHYGQPIVKLSAQAESIFGTSTLALSISHCREYATAFAVWHKMDYSPNG